MTDPALSAVSVFRLRLGVLLLALFWLPIWLVAPALARLLGADVTTVTVVTMVIQGLMGVAAVVIAGRSILTLARGTPRRKFPGAVWRVLRHGALDQQPAPPVEGLEGPA